MAAAGAVGFAFVLRPLPTLGAVAAVCTLTYALVLSRFVARLFLGALGVVLLGYAMFGRGFAYLGVPPLFVGDITLAFGLLAATLSGALPLVFRSRLAWLLIAFSIWGALRTIPFLHSYGIDALRDARSVGLQRVRADRGVMCAAGKTGWRSSCGASDAACPGISPGSLWPGASSASQTTRFRRVPGTDVKLLVLNPGLVAVHLAGAATFLLLGLGGGGERSTRTRDLVAKWALATGWTLAFLIAASITRGGFLAVLISIGVVAVFRPMATARKIATACLCAGVTIFVAPAFLGERHVARQPTFEDSRVISPGQLAANVTSIFGNRAG